MRWLRPAYDSTNLHFHVRLTNLDPGIKDDINAVGFLRDDNRREYDTNLTHTWWFQESPVEKFKAGVNYNRFYGHDSVLRSYETDISALIDFTSRWKLRLGYEDSFERFEEDFCNEITELGFGYDNREGRSFEIGVAQGRNFGDDLWLYDGELTLKISDAWNLGYEATYLDLEPDLLGRSTWLHVLRTTYYFTNDLYTKLFAQINTAVDKENIQLLTVWRFSPPLRLSPGRLPARHLRPGRGIEPRQHPLPQTRLGVLACMIHDPAGRLWKAAVRSGRTER
jgi:hypothetical protein